MGCTWCRATSDELPIVTRLTRDSLANEPGQPLLLGFRKEETLSYMRTETDGAEEPLVLPGVWNGFRVAMTEDPGRGNLGHTYVRELSTPGNVGWEMHEGRLQKLPFPTTECWG